MNNPIGDELATDELVMGEPTIDDPDAEETAIDRPAKEEIFTDEASRILARRRWSDARSELTRPTTAAQVKAQLNTYYPGQASLLALAESIVDLDARVGLRKRFRTTFALIDIVMSLSLPWSTLFDGPIWYYNVILVLCCVWEICMIVNFTSQYLDGLGKPFETDRLQKFKSLMVETLHHRQLEILCRYGDYLAERLSTLRQHISEKKLETEHKLSEYWTETSAILKEEERRETAPCHNLIRTAAQGLNWKQEATIFMIHEYAKRNNLMHTELFSLVVRQNWHAIGQRCKEDIKKLRELHIDSDLDSKAVIGNWVQIIREFRDRWVRQSEDGSTWEARSIIQKAIVAGIDDQTSLNKLAMIPEDATSKECDKAINTMKKENTRKEAQRIKMQQQADAALQAENGLLRAKVEKLTDLLKRRGASEDILAEFEAEVKRNDELVKENKRCQNRIEQLKKQCADDKTHERARKKFKNPDATENTNRNAKKTSRDAKGKDTNIRETNTNTGGKDIDNGEKNIDEGGKDSNIEEKNRDTEEKNAFTEERNTDNKANSGAIE